jgi:DNA-binding NtrC family response regulator
MNRQIKILVVDDEEHVRTSLSFWFREEGFEVAVAATGREALEQLRTGPPQILLVDIRMPGMDGLELQRRVKELLPDATVIIMTAYAAVDSAVQALKDGAYDYIVKPFNPEDLSRLVHKAAERYSLLSENRALRQRLEAAVPQLITRGEGAMGQVLEQVEQVAATNTTVLVSGESGTGKELLAGLIHARSKRCFGPLVVVNCGALSEGVLESELFGHERGAFTGATARRKGKLELAHDGTLFLDEVGDIPAKMQMDLLRVLEDKRIERVGGNRPVAVDFRLVAATNKDLQAELSAGRMREDFFFRVDVFRIHLPPLRERRGDIPLLAEAFLKRFAGQMGKRIEGLSAPALERLARHRWPGNVRELQNAIERAVVVCNGRTIEAEHFPFGSPGPDQDLSLAAVEEAHIRYVLQTLGHNVSRAAAALGVDRVTLYNKMKKYGIERP